MGVQAMTASTAQMFVEDVSARRSLARLLLPIPAALTNESIAARYAIGADSTRLVGRGGVVTFVDGSAARLNTNGWEIAR